VLTQTDPMLVDTGCQTAPRREV